MSAGDELFARTMFSNEDIKKEIDEYLEYMFKQMFRTVLIRKPSQFELTHLPFNDENMMLKTFIAEYTKDLLAQAVKEQVLQEFVKNKIHEAMLASIDKALERKLDELEKAFKRNRTIPKGVTK